jgi:hypothetical protein
MILASTPDMIRADRHGKIPFGGGAETRTETWSGAAAVAATMGRAKILGLIVDRREVGDAGAFDHMTDEELVREASRVARELGIAGPHLVEDDNKKPL